jgi:hypothetical protein
MRDEADHAGAPLRAEVRVRLAVYGDDIEHIVAVAGPFDHLLEYRPLVVSPGCGLDKLRHRLVALEDRAFIGALRWARSSRPTSAASLVDCEPQPARPRGYTPRRRTDGPCCGQRPSHHRARCRRLRTIRRSAGAEDVVDARSPGQALRLELTLPCADASEIQGLIV